ncbi:MAG TPA: hypothetical protein VGO25_09430, partial [Rhodanobacteraceae bacterium]|nr:hypothetical protein [Rhodanobacteraceae bacterium]
MALGELFEFAADRGLHAVIIAERRHRARKPADRHAGEVPRLRGRCESASQLRLAVAGFRLVLEQTLGRTQKFGIPAQR